MYSTYFITGVAGFIGSALAQRLLTCSPESIIIGIDNFNPYYSKKIKIKRIEHLSKNPRFIFFDQSICEPIGINTLIQKYKPECVIHLAAEVGVRDGQQKPSKYYETNVYGTSVLLEALLQNNHLKHTVIASSSSVYGRKKPPFKESMILTSDDPMSSYGFSKLCTESVAKNFHTLTGIPTTVIRPFSVYGPDGRPDMFPIKALIASVTHAPLHIFGDGKSKRDWTYISDVANAIVNINEQPKKFAIANIGSGKSVTLLKILSLLEKETQKYNQTILIKHEEKNYFETPMTWADTTLLKTVYRSAPIVSLEEGIEKTTAFFFKHRNLYY